MKTNFALQIQVERLCGLSWESSSPGEPSPLLEAPGHVLCGNTKHPGKAIPTVLRGEVWPLSPASYFVLFLFSKQTKMWDILEKTVNLCLRL